MTRRSRILMRRLHEREIETSIARSIPSYAGFFPAYPTPATRPRCSRRADLQGGHPCLVVGDASKEQGSVSDLLRICIPGLAHEGENSALAVVSEAMTRVQQVTQEVIPAGLRTSKIKHVKAAAGFQDTPNLPQAPRLLLRWKVVEHKGGEYPIEGGVRIREPIRKPLIELDGASGAFRLASSSGEGLRIGIQANDVNVRVKTLDQHDQAARSAADVEHAVTR